MIRTTLKLNRRGVTLVEMLVATAMCILGMWMLTWMFQQATASFSLANEQVKLTSQERAVQAIMTRDLEADKFIEDDARQNRGKKLADQRLDLLYTSGYTPPQSGFFWAKAGPVDGAMNVSEPADGYNFQSSRSTDHCLQFTVILPDVPNSRFYAEVPAGSGRSHAGTAAEVSYFLVRTSQVPNSTPAVWLHDLIRVQRLTAKSSYDAADFDRNVLTPFPAGDNVDEVMTVTGGKMQWLSELTIPIGYGASSRLAMPLRPLSDPNPNNARSARGTGSKRYGEDRLMSNVLSFEVKFTGNNGQGAAAWPTVGSADYPYDTLPFDGYFDTFSRQVMTANPTVDYKADGSNPTRPMKPLRITGALIKIRALSGTTARQTRFTVTL